MKAGWELKKFGEVLEIRNGKNQREVESEDGAYPIFGSAGNVMGYASTYICEAGATIIGRKGNINTPVYSETRFWNVDTAFGLVAKSSLGCKFLYYFCLSFDFGALNRGTTIPSLVKSELLEISMPLPPLPEQQRIVAILDEAFDGIATAQANAEKNLQNARALFESHLQSVFTERGEGWVEKPLGEIGKIRMCKRILKEQTTSKGDVPFYKIGTFGKKADAFISIEIYSAFRKKYSFPNKGDVLISAAGTIGRRVVYDGEDAYFQDSNIVWIENDQTQILNHYLYHFYGVCKWSFTQGATISRLYNESLRKIVVGFPKSHHEQRRIAAQLDDLFQETQRLESLYQRKLAALDALKQSLLHQAFSGAL